MTPYHVQVKSTNGIPSWELYYRLPGGWRLRFEREGEVYESDHETLLKAADRAAELRSTPIDPLARWRQMEVQLHVCRERTSGKYTVLAMGKGFAEDTGLEFDTEAKAREAISK